MNSRIFIGHVIHKRLTQKRHGFRYPVYLYAFDLDELALLDQTIPWFGYNRFRPVSIHDQDYLNRESGSIRDKLMSFLKREYCADNIERIELVTAARYFNYVFNPVSFYVCYRADGSIHCHVAEVNNTFQETHLYILPAQNHLNPGFVAGYRVPKVFHVSPFFDRQGVYEFLFSDIRGKLDIRVNLLHDDRYSIVSRLRGESIPLTSGNLFKTMVRYPITASLTMPRILWQAAKLHYKKGLPVYTKPEPDHSMTICIAPPTRQQRFALSIVQKFLQKIHTGCLTVEMPDRSIVTYGNPDSQLRASWRIRNYNFFSRLIRDGDLGFAESFMAGEWETDDLPKVIELMIRNLSILNVWDLKSGFFSRWKNRVGHWLRKNTIRGSKDNIQAHYDLSNDFFKTFLDSNLMYSCAIFQTPEESLEQAQINKVNSIIQKADIQESDHILEIGTGWGGFALQAVRQTGCRVTTLTISEEQKKLAEERIKEAGFQDNIEVRLCDYRTMEGQFDKIVSIEMLEAVGHEFLGAFFQACDRLLKPDGKAVIQVITIPDQRYETYRKGCDFIQKHVFPGSLLPSLNAMSTAMTHSSQLVIDHLESIGYHYPRTLHEWDRRFTESLNEMENFGFDEVFQRTWKYYFAYCEAGFATRFIDVIQMVLRRPCVA